MRLTLDQIAAAVSVRLVAWTSAHVDDSRREWVDGLAAELATIDGGWRKLAWAIDGLPLAWSLRRGSRATDETTHLRRKGMNVQPPSTSRSGFESFVLNMVSLVAWWLLLTLWIRTQFPEGLKDWQVGEITILTGCLLGVVAALAIRRTGAAYVLAGFVAFGAVEFAFHSIFGIRAVQGGPAHFADMTAGILGVTFAALAEALQGRDLGERVWSARQVGTSLLRAGVAIRRNLGAWSLLALGVIAFAVTESAARLFFGWLYYTNGFGWRLRHIFLDGKTNYAILLCALLGAVLGAVIAKWGGALAIPMKTSKPSAEAVPS